jgi:hypothetical protein
MFLEDLLVGIQFMLLGNLLQLIVKTMHIESIRIFIMNTFLPFKFTSHV